jgi:hypothetical protein
VFEAIGGILSLAVTLVAGIGAFTIAREFVRNRLRFVAAAKHPALPWVAGGLVLVAATPIAWLLPLITATTATVAGIAAGLGSHSGVKALKRGDHTG